VNESSRSRRFDIPIFAIQPGQEVKAGDLLFTIDPRPSEGALRQAEADLKRDQAQLLVFGWIFERAKKLLENSIGCAR